MVYIMTASLRKGCSYKPRLNGRMKGNAHKRCVCGCLTWESLHGRGKFLQVSVEESPFHTPVDFFWLLRHDCYGSPFPCRESPPDPEGLHTEFIADARTYCDVHLFSEFSHGKISTVGPLFLTLLFLISLNFLDLARYLMTLERSRAPRSTHRVAPRSSPLRSNIFGLLRPRSSGEESRRFVFGKGNVFGKLYSFRSKK